MKRLKRFLPWALLGAATACLAFAGFVAHGARASTATCVDLEKEVHGLRAALTRMAATSAPVTESVAALGSRDADASTSSLKSPWVLLEQAPRFDLVLTLEELAQRAHVTVERAEVAEGAHRSRTQGILEAHGSAESLAQLLALVEAQQEVLVWTEVRMRTDEGGTLRLAAIVSAFGAYVAPAVPAPDSEAESSDDA